MPVEEVRRFEKEMYSFFDTNYSGILKTLREKKAFDDALRGEVSKALDQFKEQFVASRKTAEVAAAK